MNKRLKNILIYFYNPLLLISPEYKTKVLEDTLSKTKKFSISIMLSFAVLMLIAYPTQDYKFANHIDWLIFRIVCALILSVLSIITYFSNRHFVIKLLYYMAGTFLSLAFCYAMTLGRPIQPKWIMYCPLFFFLAVEHSFIVPSVFLIILFYASKSLWIQYTVFDWMISELFVSIAALLIFHFFKEKSLVAKVINLKNKELETKIVEQQALLAQQSKMDEEKIIGASIAHEINNALCYSRNSLEGIKRECNNKFVAILEDGLSAIQLTADSIVTHAGVNESEKSQIDLRKIIDACVRLVSIQKSSQTKIEVRCDSVILWGSARGMSQIVLNLLKNSIYATRDVATGMISIDLKNISDSKCLLTVADNGVGMDEEELMKAGTPFFTKKGVDGTGLGMFTIKREVENQGGLVKIESQKGIGTKIQITLPLEYKGI
ncbi:MAG: HAMP domain-containing histidine kinase [Oligoflexia bacterium]|nr:HAMP domain-containing histidine kinase [Oligoflexia bacterium]